MSEIYTHPEDVTMVRRAENPDAPPTAWLRAVEDQCGEAWVTFDPTDPRGTLLRLIEWHNLIALDPAVSSVAAELIESAQIRMLTSLRNEMDTNRSCSVAYFIDLINAMLQGVKEPTVVEATFP